MKVKSMYIKQSMTVAFLFGVLSLWPSVASAGPIYEARTTSPELLDFGGVVTSGSPGISISDSYDLPAPSHAPGRIDRGFGEASAFQGRLGAGVNAFVNFLRGASREVGSGAFLFYDDLIFTSSQSTIDVILPLYLNGSMESDPSAFSRVDVEARLAGQTRRGTILSALHGGSSGLLSGLSPGSIDTIRYAQFSDVPTNEAVSLRLQLGTQIFVNNNSSFSDFASSFGLVSNGPTFIVPEGVDVNSQQAGIVNNQFGSSSPVPEPSSILLFGLGACGLFGYGLRRRMQSYNQTVV